VAKGLTVPCLFMIAEVSIRCQKTPEVGIRRIPPPNTPLPKTVTRQRHDCDLNPGPSAPKSSTLTTRLPSKAAVDILTSVDKGAQPPPMAGQKRKGVFLSDVQHVYFYSLFN